MVLSSEFLQALNSDARFTIDEVPLMLLVRHALPLDWTRDPFDRLLAAHSNARDVPLCSVDGTLLTQHRRILEELRRR